MRSQRDGSRNEQADWGILMDVHVLKACRARICEFFVHSNFEFIWDFKFRTLDLRLRICELLQREPTFAVGRILGRILILVSIGIFPGCSSEAEGDATSVQPAGAQNPRSHSLLEVETAKPLREDVLRQITVPADIEAFEKTTLYSKVSGYLKWVSVDIGDRVKKGETIAKIEVPEMLDQHREAEAELGSTKADYENAQAELESAKADYELKEVTYKRVHAVREEDPEVMPQQTVDEARGRFRVAGARGKVVESRINQVLSKIKKVEAALNRLQTLIAYAEIKAPFRRVVTERFVDPGALVQAAITSRNVQPIVTVATMQQLRLFLDVPEREVPFVDVGDAALITVDALPGRKFEGKVTRFAAALNPSTRTMKTEIDIPNRERLLRPGMYGQVRLTLEKHPEAMTIPSSGLRGEGEKKFVYCVLDGVIKKVEVETGFDDGIKVEITRGLQGNESVALAARGSLAEGMEVRAIRLQPGGE